MPQSLVAQPSCKLVLEKKKKKKIMHFTLKEFILIWSWFVLYSHMEISSCFQSTACKRIAVMMVRDFFLSSFFQFMV